MEPGMGSTLSSIYVLSMNTYLPCMQKKKKIRCPSDMEPGMGSTLSSIYVLSMNTLGDHLGKNGQNYQFSVFCSKSVFRSGVITSQIFRGLSALEPPPPQKLGAKGVQRGPNIMFFFIIYSSNT